MFSPLFILIVGAFIGFYIGIASERWFGRRRPPALTPPAWAVVNGLKAYPDCVECQCYPEGRLDCPDHLQCRLTLGMPAPSAGKSS